MSYLSGITCTAVLNTTELPTTAWEVDANAQILSFVNSMTGNHPVKQATIRDATFKITVDFDPDINPFASPLSIRESTVLTDVALCLDGPSGATAWAFPSAIVQRVSQRQTREGKIMTDLYCQASGVFTAPGGTSA